MRLYLFILALSLCVFSTFIKAEVTPLTNQNIDGILTGNEIVFVNFYADWCRFSQQLKPIYEQASNNFKDRPTGKVMWASVDADRNPDIASKYHVNKYPTLKLFRYGELVKREYRSARSADALTEYINHQLEESLKPVTSKAQLDEKLNSAKKGFIGYFPQLAGTEFENLRKVAAALREECDFFAASGPEFHEVTQGGPKLTFRSQGTGDSVDFTGDWQTFEYMKQWISDKCISLIREITFQNAEELTEEGLPFLILFKHPDDKTSEKEFTENVIREIPDQTRAINALVADGVKFAHPLHHMGKTGKDLPVIAIDSFRHMYLFPNYADSKVPGKLRQFVLDLHSGKLHREFHHGPDPAQADPSAPQQQKVEEETEAPPSVFQKLKPDGNRYTLLKEEL
ncbi:hypothetical protein WR25_21676 [Diploscapter pachys]|uniref:Thioredoxin domain-containing protein n=1 Tax=Diploscapter pachys TaxID=2018661 RepID=A0A2A2LBU6_9BILA|nr:hypothetical protein WR25_21676 [Diploscapter pachys]